MSKEKIILFSILLFAFLTRVAGIGYGLPLQLHDDEPPFVLAALKMMQLRTVLPVFHAEEFKPILFYLPYASYLYLPFFVIYALVAGLYGVLSGAFSWAQLPDYLMSDLSPFFLIARFLSVLAGVATVYFVYLAARNIFRNHQGEIASDYLAMTNGGKIASLGPPDATVGIGRNDGFSVVGIFSALFLAASLLHTALSMSARHWVWLPFVISAVLVILSHPNWLFKKRYSLAVLVGGIGVGFNIMSAITAPLILLYYFLFENRGLKNLLRDKFTYAIASLFIVLIVLPIALYPAGLGFRVDVSANAGKTLAGVLSAPLEFLKPVVMAEPVLILFALFGLIFAAFKRKRFFILAVIFIFGYIEAFYFGFYYAHRFALGLFPIFAILAGYGAAQIFKYALRAKYGKIATQSLAMTTILVLLVPLVVVLRLDYLAIRGDAKNLAREWLEENVSAGERVITASKRVRLSTTQEALAEQEKIDPASIRKTEQAEVLFIENSRGYKSFHALNLDAVGNEAFYAGIGEYIKKEGYKYLLITPGDLPADRAVRFYEATREASFEAYFGSPDESLSLTSGQFWSWSWELFKLKEFGPTTAIYKL